MRHLLKLLFLPCSVLLSTAQGKGQTRTITFNWPNDPCQQNINCPGGCSACNEAQGADDAVMAASPVFIGLDICPHPVAVGDNALSTSGWGLACDDAHRMIISGLVGCDVRIDSVIIRHRSSESGPVRLVTRVQDLGDGGGAVEDEQVPAEFGTMVLTQAGVVQVPPGAAFSSYQIQLQAYGSTGGEWVVDEVRIVVTLLNPGPVTGVTELAPNTITSSEAAFDPLGRRVTSAHKGLRFQAHGTLYPH